MFFSVNDCNRGFKAQYFDERDKYLELKKIKWNVGIQRVLKLSKLFKRSSGIKLQCSCIKKGFRVGESLCESYRIKIYLFSVLIDQQLRKLQDNNACLLRLGLKFDKSVFCRCEDTHGRL